MRATKWVRNFVSPLLSEILEAPAAVKMLIKAFPPSQRIHFIGGETPNPEFRISCFILKMLVSAFKKQRCSKPPLYTNKRVRDLVESPPLCCTSSDPQMLLSTHDSSQTVLLSSVLIRETSARPREDDPDPPTCLSVSNQRHG